MCHCLTTATSSQVSSARSWKGESSIPRSALCLELPRSLLLCCIQNAEEYTIHVNIPILSCVPTPWQLCLVDNPSFKEFTGMGMKEELQDEVMALSAYIYTAPYKQLIDAVDANAFKLISEKDQAKGRHACKYCCLHQTLHFSCNVHSFQLHFWRSDL